MRSNALAQWLAGAVPWIAYVTTCSAHAYWLDSGEFVAAAVRLDISHPPGHPLTELYGKLWSLLPLGSLPLRVALGQAAASAAACVLLCRAGLILLRRLDVPDLLAWPCAVLGAWLSGLSYGVWFQAIRPEVYALQTLCMSGVIERVLAWQSARAPAAASDRAASRNSARYAGPAALALGLGLANHHFTALLLVPALGLAALPLLAARRWSALGFAAWAGALALATYAYLPLRAASPLPVNLGHPDDLARLYWVVSARVYAQNAGNTLASALDERLADVLVILVESFGPWPLLAALIGLYTLLRRRETRRQGLFVLAILIPVFVMRAWLAPVRSNPDVLGYFGPGLLLIGLLAGCAVAQALALLTGAAAARARWLPALAAAAPLLAWPTVRAACERSSLRGFSATDSFDEQRVRSLPPRSIVVETMPQTVFRHWAVDAVEHVRPDVKLVPVPFLTHPGMHDTLLARAPELRPIVDHYLRDDRLSLEQLRIQARAQPVWVELDPRVAPALYPSLAPAHLLHALAPPDRAALARALPASYRALYRQLGAAVRESETARQLLAIHYLGAVQFAALGWLELAEAEIARARALAPHDRNVSALASALERADGPLSVREFLVL